MFERPHHQRIALLLGVLDAALMRRLHCLFGRGTAMALRFGEYRESVDVDFLVSDEGGYRELRQLVRGSDGISALVRDGAQVPPVMGEVRVDQYGIRTRVRMMDTPIKFEIVREGRIALDEPGPDDEVCGISTLSGVDMAASKLLANSDRGLDDSTFNRDLIDLAMMSPGRSLLEQALDKAGAAYGNDVRRDLDRSVERLRGREGWLERCMQAMDITLPKAVVWQRLRILEQKLVQLS
ncbi:nucleotidyl transferase AbiEii/AbiGii toxin family protein [Luteimonas sp. A478]